MTSPRTLNQTAIRRAWSHTANRFGGILTYKRYKGVSYDPEEGEVKEFWEEVDTRFVQGQGRQYEIAASGGLLRADDIWVLIPREIFTQQEEESRPPMPQSGDEVEIDGQEWLASLGGEIVWELDPSRTLFKIWLRRKDE